MGSIAHLGAVTEVLELAATSIGAGILVGGFLFGCAAVIAGRTRREMEDDALRNAFMSSLGGILCLLIDVFWKYGL